MLSKLAGMFVFATSAWRPFHGAATQQVEMQMVDGLPTVGSAVNYNAVTIL
jgi:hypothetical protein